MAWVYKLKRPGADPVALKVGRGVDLEFEAMRRIAPHENVVKEYSQGAANFCPLLGELPFLTMEYLEGKDLCAIIWEKGPILEKEAARLGLGLISGLKNVWDAGIVHRDLKPENIFLRKEDSDRPVVFDFGIALAQNSDGGVLGSPEYVSPEQIKRLELDWRSDQYSLGLLLFFAVSGEIAFDDTKIIDVLTKKIRFKDAEKIREAKAAANNPFYDMLYKMTMRDREQRFQTYQEMLEAFLGV